MGHHTEESCHVRSGLSDCPNDRSRDFVGQLTCTSGLQVLRVGAVLLTGPGAQVQGLGLGVSNFRPTRNLLIESYD